MVSVANDCVIVNDFNGGWSGKPQALIYVWDKDGLWVGHLFEHPNLAGGLSLDQYCLSSDNGSGTVFVEPATGDLLYFRAGRMRRGFTASRAGRTSFANRAVSPRLNRTDRPQ